MLDDYKESQTVAYAILNNAILNNKLSHAYLIDTNHYEDAFSFVLAFVKAMICKNHYTSLSNCDICSICRRIDNNNYPEVKIIETDSLVIKKEQLLELQTEFSRSSIEGDYRIYIIKDCDKMNKQASNSILKFLEEPVPGIIAILMTNQIGKLLNTIVSRCQLIRLNRIVSLKDNNALENLALTFCDSTDKVISFQNEEKNKIMVETVVSFLDYFEEYGLDILLYMKNVWYNNVSTREDSVLAFTLMIYFYYDLLNCKVNKNQYFFCDKLSIIEKCSKMNSIESILHKIDVVLYGYEMVKCNLNLNLLMDDIVIKLGDVSEYC